MPHTLTALPDRDTAQLALELWCDLDTTSAHQILQHALGLSDAELIAQPLLTVAGLTAECVLNAGDHQTTVHLQLLERIAQLVEALPGVEGENDDPHWQMLCMIVHRWRRRYPAALELANNLADRPQPVSGCVGTRERRWGRSALDQSRPGLLALQRGITHALVGNWALALELSTQASRCAALGGRQHYAGVNGTANAALIAAVTGHTHTAQRLIAEYLRSPAMPEWCAPQIALSAQIATVLLSCDQAEYVKEASHTGLSFVQGSEPDVHKTYADISEMLDRAEMWPFAVHALNRCDLQRGEPQLALHRLHGLSVTHATDVRTSQILSGSLLRDYCDALLDLGEGNRLLHVAELAHANTHTLIPLAHMWLRCGEHQRALRGAAQALRMPQITRRDDLEAHLLVAVAHLGAGEEAAAMRHFRVCSGEISRDFPGLLLRFSHDSLTRLWEMMEASRPVPLPSVMVNAWQLSPVYLVQLTAREQEILTHLSAGRSPQQISVADTVSLHTVRTQIKTLYRKLEVGSVSEALARAGSLGVLCGEH